MNTPRHLSYPRPVGTHVHRALRAMAFRPIAWLAHVTPGTLQVQPMRN
ncbi:MAG: hypothetical protein JSU95_08155 [Betaproteobacteria bacterium]|nr:MAG: hypothetical protein JSU95_08155 [Betaproteobacteria bacterium]